jgi:hypothetical protein
MACGKVTIEADDDSSGHVIFGDPWDTFAAWEQRGRYRAISTVIVGRIITSLAGALAEIEIIGECQGGDGDDQYRARPRTCCGRVRPQRASAGFPGGSAAAPFPRGLGRERTFARISGWEICYKPLMPLERFRRWLGGKGCEINECGQTSRPRLPPSGRFAERRPRQVFRTPPEPDSMGGLENTGNG